jgi:hypothetical protein
LAFWIENSGPFLAELIAECCCDEDRERLGLEAIEIRNEKILIAN